MKSLDILKEEHSLVERVLDLLERAGHCFHAGQPLPADFESWAIAFLWHFADHCHHSRELASPFPLLRVRGISSDGGPVGLLLAEYKRARVYLERIRDAHQRRDERGVAVLLREYGRLLRQHIATENQVLSQMAETCLREEGDADQAESFHSIDRDQEGHELRGRYDAEINHWEAEFRVPVEQR